MSTKELRKIASDLPNSVTDEMAIPSYTHRNPLIRWLMWKRLAVVQALCEGLHVEVALDYGTGTGVMLPFLSKIANHVVAFDKVIIPAARLIEHHELRNVELKEVDTLPILLPDESVDLILCLDALEHIKPLQEVTKELTRVLKPGGRLVMSGPSENAIHKLGRLLAGFRKRATYHRWNVDDVNKALRAYLALRHRKTLLGPVRLFEISVFEKPSGNGSSSARDLRNL